MALLQTLADLALGKFAEHANVSRVYGDLHRFTESHVSKPNYFSE